MAAARALVGSTASDDAPQVDDRELVDRVKRGDATAYDVLVRRHLARATMVARRLLGNMEDAEDLVQEAFIRALDRISTFDQNRAFAPWFFRLLKAANPLELAEREELRERFVAALEGLPPRQRLVISMFEVDGLSTAEIADALGISCETVRWHHHQARQALRHALAAFRG
jgi:RNA polymerase sigma-70 factor (ECF subfamily)